MSIKKIQIYFGEDDWIYFKVPSSSRNEYQYVSWDKDNGWNCTCEHYQFRKLYCKHMEEAKKFLDALNKDVQNCDTPFSG